MRAKAEANKGKVSSNVVVTKQLKAEAEAKVENIKENDKIMVTKNDYDLDLSNGDVGIIKSLKLAGKQELVSSIVNFEMQGEIGLESANYDDVALAYTCSIHKTQGSEYKKVILVLDDIQSNAFFLNKKLLYTAITRTKEELYVIATVGSVLNFTAPLIVLLDITKDLFSNNKEAMLGTALAILFLVGAGAVGTSFIYSAVNQGIASEYVLIDAFPNSAKGNAMDIADTMAVLPNSFTSIKAGDYSDCADADVIVITAGRPQKEGETRLDMIAGNAVIMRDIANEIVKSGFNGITVIASNPVDVLTSVYQEFTKFPAHKVIDQEQH
ncbi:hypothetical protein FQA39_LY12894 [Lamprigera yunnana]|nr:hypothetical protein FQA39_LY12894 [Lamprigera yunnana]